jgi:hypothetical protein
MVMLVSVFCLHVSHFCLLFQLVLAVVLAVVLVVDLGDLVHT